MLPFPIVKLTWFCIDRYFTRDQYERLQTQIHAFSQLASQLMAMAAQAAQPLARAPKKSTQARSAFAAQLAPTRDLLLRWAAVARGARLARDYARQQHKRTNANQPLMAPPASASVTFCQFPWCRPGIRFVNPRWPSQRRQWAGGLLNVDNRDTFQPVDTSSLPALCQPEQLCSLHADVKRLHGCHESVALSIVDPDAVECVVSQLLQRTHPRACVAALGMPLPTLTHVLVWWCSVDASPLLSTKEKG